MRTAANSRRVLITAPVQLHQRFGDLFRDHTLSVYDTIFSSEIDEARFFMQHSPVDVWLAHEDVGDGHVAGSDGLLRADVPTVYLCEPNAKSILPALNSGTLSWLPSPLIWEHPHLLTAALRQACKVRKAQRRAGVQERKWRRCRRHVDRLVHLIWRTTPAAPPLDWFPQRFAMERLQEEVARANRFGEPLTVAVGEVRMDGPHDANKIADWMPRVIGSAKRRCDVAGQYGLNGFLLVMVHTPLQGAMTCCRRMREAMEKAGIQSAKPLHAFFGVAEAGKECTPQKLLRQAEESLDGAIRGVSNVATTT